MNNKYNIENTDTFYSLKNNDNKYIIWSYWENKPGKLMPSHISLCFKTLHHHCDKNYTINILNEKTVHDYLPDLRKDLDNLLLAQKVDYIRVYLLYKYGGIWIDADTIIMSNLEDIRIKLNQGWDYIGFGCTGLKCFNGYPNPSNGVMASQKNSKLMGLCKTELDVIIGKQNKFDYFDLGKKVIWRQLGILMKEKKYNYYHYPSEYDGSRDKNGNWIHSENHLSEKPTELLNPDKLFFVFLANNELANEQRYNWFSKLTEEQIVDGKWWISILFRRALGR